MISKLAEAAELQLIEDAKRMTPEQRLRAFIELSRRMIELRQAASETHPSQADRLHVTPSHGH